MERTSESNISIRGMYILFSTRERSSLHVPENPAEVFNSSEDFRMKLKHRNSLANTRLMPLPDQGEGLGEGIYFHSGQ